jgi:hypothetical protein
MYSRSRSSAVEVFNRSIFLLLFFAMAITTKQ